LGSYSSATTMMHCPTNIRLQKNVSPKKLKIKWFKPCYISDRYNNTVGYSQSNSETKMWKPVAMMMIIIIIIISLDL